jgi:hypothetical protein
MMGWKAIVKAKGRGLLSRQPWHPIFLSTGETLSRFHKVEAGTLEWSESRAGLSESSGGIVPDAKPERDELRQIDQPGGTGIGSGVRVGHGRQFLWQELV